MTNANSKEYLDKILTQVISNLDNTKHTPSVQMNEVPLDMEDLGDVDEDMPDAIDTKGGSQFAKDKLVQADGEFYDDDEKDKGEKNIQENGNVNTNANGNGNGNVIITEEEQAELDKLNNNV